MHYIWEHRLWPAGELRTTDGVPVSVIDPGRHNGDSGPDFFNAKIRIGGKMWVGNVEIHVRASDWHRHGHDKDPAYDSVVLHVVDRDDAQICRQSGEPIPQLRMPCNPGFGKEYERLTCRADIDLPCAGEIAGTDRVVIADWLTALAFERLYDKTDRIRALLDRFAGNWEQAAYVTIARALGFGTNAQAFEMLALATPLQAVGKHSDNDTAIEAILFGQSGLLEPAPSDPYVDTLRREYRFLSAKFGLRPIAPAVWKMSRMRPANFPHRRIATLASMLAGGFRMFRRVSACDCVDQARALFRPRLGAYWQEHYTFGKPAARQGSEMSRSSVDLLVINAVVPLLHAYGTAHGNDTMCERAIAMMAAIPAESNSIVTAFGRAGIRASDAMISQALIQLRRAYCEQRKCLFCRIGHRALRKVSTRPISG